MRVRVDATSMDVFVRVPDDATYGDEINVPQKVVSNWMRIKEEFDQIQDEIERIYEKE